MDIFKKIKEARLQLGLSQTDMANFIGVKPNEVSKLEAGGKKFVPNEYIAFLHKKGYDINSLFDKNQDLIKLKYSQDGVNEVSQEYILKTDVRQENQIIPIFNLDATASLVELFRDFNENIPIGHISIPNLPKCDGSTYMSGDSMYPLLKAGDILAYKVVHNINDGIFWGETYIISLTVDDEEFITVKYIQKSDKGENYIKLVSYNTHHQPKDIPKKSIRALAIVKASVRYNTMN